MKNKILLTLILLIPSLCFGQAISVAIIENKEGETITIHFNSSIKYKSPDKSDPTRPKEVLQTQGVFKTHKGVIYPKEQQTEQIHFIRLFAKVLKLDETRAELFSFFNENREKYHFQFFIEMWMIKEGYALTFKKEGEIIGTNILKDQYFFYKPDK
jgi:hypothetical protein